MIDVVATARSTVAKQRSSILAPLLAILLIPAVLGSSKTIFNDGDVSWHIATGQWILDHRAIPHVDPFSYTWVGKPWVPIEWLSEVIYASAFRLASYGGVAAVVTAALMALHALVYCNAARWLRAALLPVVAMDFALIPMLSARPHVLTWPLLALWIWLLLRARQQGRAPPLAAALLMTLWANLHGGFVFGLAIAGLFGLEALVSSQDKAKALRQWLVFGVACLAAIFINGNGVEGVFYPLRFTHFQMLPLIDEWKPSSPAKTPVFFGILAIVIGVIAWKRPRLLWTRWLLLAMVLGLSMLQVRHQALFAIVAAMILPEGFARSERQPTAADPALRWITAGGAAILLVSRALMPIQPAESETNPWSLIAAAPAELRSERVLNGYSMGGPLILAGIRPYVDGRGDMYGDQLVVGYSHIIHGDAGAFDAAVRQWNIRWAILPGDSKLISLLARDPHWHLLRRDKVGVIYVRAALSASDSLPAPSAVRKG